MGRRNVQGEDVPWPRTKTLGNSLRFQRWRLVGRPRFAALIERLAAEGKELIVYRFGGSSVGLPSTLRASTGYAVRARQFTNQQPTRPRVEHSMSSILSRLKRLRPLG